MLDLFAIFTRGGALLWTLQFTSLRHSPIEALNALVKSCLLEERSGETTFTFVPKNGAHQALKWTFHNGLGLVFVAAYQKALSVLYVDELLASVKAEFTTRYYKPNVLSYSEFTDTFQRMYRECEARADERKAAGPPAAAAPAAPGQAAGRAAASAGAAQAKGAAAAGKAGQEEEEEEEEEADEGAHASAAPQGASGGEEDGTPGGAFDLSKLKGAKGGPRGARPGKPPAPSSAGKKKEEKEKDAPKKKARQWGTLGGGGRGSDTGGRIDYTDGDPSEFTAGSESDRNGGYSDVDGASARATPAQVGVSQVDLDSDAAEEDSVSRIVREAEALAAANNNNKGAAAASKGKGLLGGFMSNLAMRVVGKGALTAEDLQPALADMKRKIMEKNVAEEIAQNICDSVGRSLEGQKLASFTGMGTFVARAFEDALSGILHKRTVDMLLDIRKSQERGKPYVVVFCGVNGVGKSTNLAKIAYWLGQHGVKVLIAACDTFRAGAVEQLKTHCARLQVPLYERGYEKDPAKVAAEAIKQAEREGRHVVLVDTAGRMQDNEPLMRALSNLINMNNPNLVLFVGEALVGNDAVDQLVKFNRALHDLAPPTATRRHAIDGIVLTKFDTIDDKVGAAVSMVYASGAPIMFLGCGQTYADLKRLNVKSVVNALLK